MGCLAIKELLLRCEKCFMLKLFLIKPDYPQTTLICRCSCGLFSVPLLSFTKALQVPLPFKIKCTLCNKEPKHPSYCTGCRKTFCSTCKFKHNTQIKTKTKHNLIDSYKYDFYCAEHQDVFNTAYCDNCKLDICQKCINEKLHTGHIVYLYSQLQLNKKDEKKTKNDIEASAEKIIKKINMSKSMMKQINDKEQINYLKEVVNTTMMDNKSIIALIQFFYQIYLRAKHKNYAIIYNLKENLKFNLFPIQLCPSNTLDEKLKDFIEFLKSDFVLFKRIISTKKRQNTLGSSKGKSEKSKMKAENHEKIINSINDNENKENYNNIIDNNELEDKKDLNTSESNDSMNEDFNEDKEEEIINDTKINEINSLNNLNNRYNSIDGGFRKRGISIFDINKIIKEKYDDAIFKEDTEEIDSNIKPEPYQMEKISDKELNKIDESTDDINNNENKEIIDSNNSKIGYEETLNQEEINIDDSPNIEKKDENEEDDIDMNLNINFEQEKIEQKQYHEKPLIEEKIIDMDNNNNLKEENLEIDNFDNNQNNMEINEQNGNYNQDINDSNEEENNEINIQPDENINVEKETTIENYNDKVIKNNEEIENEEKKEEKNEEKIEGKKEEKKEEKKDEHKIKEKKEEKKEENKIKEKKDEKKIEKKDENKIKEKKEERKEESKIKEKKEEKKDEKKDENKLKERKDENKIKDKKEENKIKDKKEENKIKEKKDEKKIEKKDENKLKEKKDENKIKEKKDEKKEDKKIEKKDENKLKVKKDENKIKEKKEEKKVEKKIEKKDENKFKEKKDEKKDENKIKGKKEEKKDDLKTKNLQKNPKVTNNENQAKKVPPNPKTETAPKKLSSLQERMSMFEKKNTSNNNKNDIKAQIVKNSLKSGILNNPKFSNLAKMMNVKMPHGPGPRRENLIEKPNIIEERIDPNTLLMNIPTANKNFVKKKPKKVNFE